MEVLFGDDRSLTNLDFGWDYLKAIWNTLDRFTETPTAELSMQLQIYQGAFQAEFALSVLGAYYTAGALVEVRAMYQAWAAGGSLFGVGNELVKNPGIVNGLRQVGSQSVRLLEFNKNFAPGQLQRHFLKHAKDWGAGNITQQAYLRRAQSLLNSKVGDYIEGFTSKNGWIFRYNIRTNEFGVAKPNGIIETLFRPDKGYQYWLDQISRYGN